MTGKATCRGFSDPLNLTGFPVFGAIFEMAGVILALFVI
jgi:hypothetical protein